MFLEPFFAGVLGGVSVLSLFFVFTFARKKIRLFKDNKKRLAQIEKRKNKNLLLD